MIKNIIFDFDGVLVDSEILVAKAFSSYLNELGYSYEEKKFADFAGKKTVQVISHLAKNYQIRDEKKFYNDVMKISENIYKKKLTTVNGAYDFLKNSKFKHFIGSNSTKNRIIDGIQTVNFNSFFRENQIYAFDMVNKPKPFPDVYLKVINDNNLIIDETIVIEDSVVGVKAGVAAGLMVIGITAGGHWYPDRDVNELYTAGASKVISNYSELNQTIESLKNGS